MNKTSGRTVIDLNALALRISEIEGKKEETDIAQIKEIIGALGEVARENGPHLWAEIASAIYRRAGIK